MAIVSISRIQIRRGREDLDGVPQLAGGELAWAVDTQKLYIGNGAVSEGAPAVGNTELLSTKSNLFDLADQYVYRKITPEFTGEPDISRTLQERLDETVSIRSFGAEGDGTNQTAKIQRAIYKLFNNTDKGQTVSRVTLRIQAGTYTINESIKIPPHTNIVGDGSAKTVFIQTGNHPIFETVNDLIQTDQDQSQTDTENQAREIRIQGITLQTLGDNVGLWLRDCANSEFTDVQIKSDWVSGDPITPGSIGIRVTSTSNLPGMTNVANNKFDRCRIEGFAHAIDCTLDSLMMDNIFINSKIEMCGYGITLGRDIGNNIIGRSEVGPRGNKFTSTKFFNIDKNAIIIYNGEQNVSSNNTFNSVGNDGSPDQDNNLSITPRVAVIDFKSTGNKSSSDFFGRTVPLAVDTRYQVGTPYVPEITGHHAGALSQELEVSVPYNQFSSTPLTIFRLPADVSKNIEISYVFKSLNYDNERTGTLHINIDKQSDTVSMDDEFRYSGTLTASQPNPSFTAELGELNNNTLIIKANYSLQATSGEDDGILHLSIRSTF